MGSASRILHHGLTHVHLTWGGGGGAYIRSRRWYICALTPVFGLRFVALAQKERGGDKVFWLLGGWKQTTCRNEGSAHEIQTHRGPRALCETHLSLSEKTFFQGIGRDDRAKYVLFWFTHLDGVLWVCYLPVSPISRQHHTLAQRFSAFCDQRRFWQISPWGLIKYISIYLSIISEDKLTKYTKRHT